MTKTSPENSQHPAVARDTAVVAAGRPPREHDQPVNLPITLTSTYFGRTPISGEDRAYGRYSNPTWDGFEETLGELEGAELPALVYSSGMAAVAAALSLVPAGGTLIMPRHSYQGSLVLAQEEAQLGRYTLLTVDITDTDAVIHEIQNSQSALLWLESPTNPMLEIAEVEVLTKAAHDAGVLVIADNTFSTPLVQRPLEAGVDIVLHSVTKYLAGHSDVVLGALVTSQVDLRERLHTYRSHHGAIAGPFETWLALRGVRTLAVRIERSQASALELAGRLQQHAEVKAVRFPGLPEDPGHERATAQMDGFGSILCIEVRGGEAAADAVIDAVRLWTPATSLGGVESLIERRRRHRSEAVTVPANLLRLSVGIENVEDLWSDLDQALRAI
ncbi:trans-sulfuration enzyme family protein [Arthrobacter roseus]|uniref:trans-sulfuration enzyme family protein n=1 Tax=Arthrobacter roseus TaxID=136274 RepID=UPI001962B48A|nr:PLP-dependent aspartate aminotransferase family protein [Arthrobacter roseus]MBM7847689.1 cystathionine gamma-synthase [Arthrobacter roseus]